MKTRAIIFLCAAVALLSSCGDCNCNKYAPFALEGYKVDSSKQFR